MLTMLLLLKHLYDGKGNIEWDFLDRKREIVYKAIARASLSLMFFPLLHPLSLSLSLSHALFLSFFFSFLPPLLLLMSKWEKERKRGNTLSPFPLFLYLSHSFPPVGVCIKGTKGFFLILYFPDHPVGDKEGQCYIKRKRSTIYRLHNRIYTRVTAYVKHLGGVWLRGFGKEKSNTEKSDP